MPPVGAPRPDRATYDAALASIGQELDTAVSRRKSPAANSQEIATRLATILWNSAPDTLLLQDAQSGRLTDPATLERQIQRMLADDRAEAFVSRFFVPWLELDKLEKADPDKKYFPDYDVSLRDSLAKETELFLLSQLREDRDPIELWSANYTFLNEQLAKHYDIPDGAPISRAREFRRVTSTPERAGLLGQGSILMVTSRHQHGVDAAYTSPAARGSMGPQALPGSRPRRSRFLAPSP